MSASHDKRPWSVNSRLRHVIAACCVMALMMSPVVLAQTTSSRSIKPRVTQPVKKKSSPTNPQPAQAARKGAKGPKVSRITPQIPKANRNQTNKVFLENADVLSANEAISTEILNQAEQAADEAPAFPISQENPEIAE